jgi:CheY-like chemotaxis protein/anti-sigma regulatory factor (Ser/Thr protein kinase)
MERCQDILPEKQHKNLGKVLVSGEHLLSLINNVLDLSKIEAGRMDLHETVFAMDTVVDTCVKTTEPLFKPGVEVKISRPERPLSVKTDEGKLKQIVINLLSNAAKFTKNGSVEVVVEDHGDRITLAVKDTGIGISEEAQQRVFEEFSQADGSTTREYGGTGLGLTICRKLAQLMGGDITVSSVEGEGSSFTIHLPGKVRVELERPAPTAKEGNAAPAASQSLVLAIDDDPDAIELVKENLSAAGYKVVGANSANDGLRKARILQPSAITLDINLGGTDGWQVLHELKDNAQTRDIPVIMLTVVDQQRLGFRLGASEYLQKPIDRTELLAALSRVSKSKAKVLVIDDNPDVIEMVQQILQGEGHEIIGAENGEVGLQRIEADQPDIVFLDLMMPVLDGFGVLEKLRANPEHMDLPVIVLTAKILTRVEEAILEEGAQTVVKKEGLDSKRLIQELEMAMGGKKAEPGEAEA